MSKEVRDFSNVSEEIRYRSVLRELVQNNKDRCEEFWDNDEAEKTEYVLQRLDEEIGTLKRRRVMEERAEILSRKEEYKRKFKEIWESISEEKKDMWTIGEWDADDEDSLRIQELKKWFLGNRLYEKLKDMSEEAGWGRYYCSCWCLGNCCMCHELDYWNDLDEEKKISCDSDVRWLLDIVIREE